MRVRLPLPAHFRKSQTKKLFKNNFIVALISVVILALIIVSVDQMIVLRKAHSTFDNYYAFRGCIQLLARTDSYGICKTDSGQTIKIVQFNGRWYLDGDLPICWQNICL